MKKYYLILLTLFALSCYSQNNIPTSSKQQQKILKKFTYYLLDHKTPPWGVTAFSAVAQCKNHPPVIVFGGTYSRQGGRSIKQNSIFQIGSITKSFISVVILQLASTNKLNLNNKVKQYFSQYPKWGNITIKQLLNMTSGIPDAGGGPNNIFDQFTAHEYHGYTSPSKIVNLVYRLPVDFNPGTQYEYSNSNYTLLGLIIEKITHRSPEHEIKERIINKLNLSHTYFVHNTMQDVQGVNVRDIVHGYSYWSKNAEYSPYAFQKFGQDTFRFSLSIYNYAGAIISTPTDINAYIHALYTPGALLDKAALAQLTTLISIKNGQPYVPEKNPDVMGYGLGIFGLYDAKLKSMLYFYQGQTDGFQFIYIYNPKNKQYLTFGINTISNIINKNSSFSLFYRLSDTCKHV